MIRVSLIFFLISVLFSCKKKDDRTELIVDPIGKWDILSITAYDGSLTDELNSTPIGHYKSVGVLEFTSGGKGLYSYENEISNVEWSLISREPVASLNLKINITDPKKLQSYFLYYHSGGNPTFLYYPGLGENQSGYEVHAVNANTLALRLLPIYSSSSGTYSYEIILGRQ